MVKNITQIPMTGSIEQVWNALTVPSQIRQWQFGSDVLTSWEVGSSIRFINALEDRIIEQSGRVLEFTPQSTIRYSLSNQEANEETPSESFEIGFHLSKKSDGVMLEFVQIDKRNNAKSAIGNYLFHPIFRALKKFVEDQSSLQASSTVVLEEVKRSNSRFSFKKPNKI